MDLQAWVKKGKEKLLKLGWKEWSMLLVAGLCCLVIVLPIQKEKPSETADATPAKMPT